MALCKDRARSDGNSFKMYRDHICQAQDPDEVEKALHNYEIRKKAAECHDTPRLIIHEARLKLSSDAAVTSPHYNVLFNVLEEMIIFYQNLKHSPILLFHSIFKILLRIKSFFYMIIMMLIVDY